jgi:hypothetical protein
MNFLFCESKLLKGCPSVPKIAVEQKRDSGLEITSMA